MRKVILTAVILVVLVAGVVSASVASYIWFEPSKTGSYSGPTGTVVNLTGSTGTTFNAAYDWVAYPVQVNSSSYWINVSTTSDEVGTNALVLYLMNATQFNAFESNTDTASLSTSGPTAYPSFNYQGNAASTYYIVWMSVYTASFWFYGSIAVTAKT